MSHRRDCVIVGAGHNGLIAGCYLAAAGFDVEIVERDVIAGGAVSTVERWPGVRVDRGSSLHVMIRHTGIVDELELATAGLIYDDVELFAVAPDVDRGALAFHCDLDQTCADIGGVAGRDAADGYRTYVTEWTPRWRALLQLADATNPLEMLRSARPLAREWRIGLDLSRRFLTTAEASIGSHITDQSLAAAIAWWAAQAGPAPHETGTAPIAGSIALMHLKAPGRPRGGSGRLSDALVTRFAASGGTLRLGDPVESIETRNGQATGVRTRGGSLIEAPIVIAACHARTTFDLLQRNDLSRAVRVGDGIGLVLRLLTNAPPSFDGDNAPADRGMTLLARSGQQIRTAAADALAGEPSRDPAIIVMTPTIADPTLAPIGRHVVTVWSQWAPYDLATGDWDSRREREADRVVNALDRWSPGIASHILDRYVQTPLDLERELALPRGDVMHVSMGLDAMFGLRPLPKWGRRSPIDGLYLTGASTHPGGGVWGASGRAVARVVISDHRRWPRRHWSKTRA